MKSILRFILVLVGLLLFLGIGYLLQNTPNLEPNDEETPPIQEPQPEDTPNGDKEPEDIITDPELNYNMEPLDIHSIDHAINMIDAIDNYKSSGTYNHDVLINELYYQNFVHFEKELQIKNEEVYIALSGKIEDLNQLTNNDQADLLTILDDIRIILNNIIEVKKE